MHDRTKTANQMPGFLLELGINQPKGSAIMKRLASVLAEHELPVRLTVLLQRLHDHFVYLDEQIKALDKELADRRHSNVVACALANKLARIAWAIAAHHTQYEAGPDALSA